MSKYAQNNDNLDRQAGLDSPVNPNTNIRQEAHREVNTVAQPVAEMKEILESQESSLGYREELQTRLVRVLDNLKSNDIRKQDGKGGDIEKTPTTVVEILRFNNRRAAAQNNELEQIINILESVI